MKSTSASPIITHVPTNPTAGSAHVKSPSHGFVSDAEADRLERVVQRPFGLVDHLPDHRDDDQRDDLRQEQHGAEPGLAADRRP